MRYKPCCDRRCCLGTCSTREAGGCYCICRMKDHEGTLLNELDGTAVRHSGCIVYRPDSQKIPLEGKEREKVLMELQKVREILSAHEIKEE